MHIYNIQNSSGYPIHECEGGVESKSELLRRRLSIKLSSSFRADSLPNMNPYLQICTPKKKTLLFSFEDKNSQLNTENHDYQKETAEKTPAVATVCSRLKLFCIYVYGFRFQKEISQFSVSSCSLRREKKKNLEALWAVLGHHLSPNKKNFG